MKTIKQIFTVSLLVVFMLGCFSVKAQKNNPYNSFGVKVVKSVNLVLKDYNEGKVKNIDKETLDYYSKKLNLDPISVEFASTIVKKVKNENLAGVISNSKYSIFTKNTLTNAFNLNIDAFSDLVNSIKSNKLNEKEKIFLLKAVSMVYNFKIHNNHQNTSRFICADSPSACGAGIGSIIGAAIGGGPGMLIGAIIGGLVGSVS